MPARGKLGATFEHLADVTDRWTQVLGLDRFALYVFDYPGLLEGAVAGQPGGDPGDAGTADDDLAVHARRARHDPLFLPAGAEAFKRDIPDAEVRFLDTGHFALETHVEEIAGAIGEFLTR